MLQRSGKSIKFSSALLPLFVATSNTTKSSVASRKRRRTKLYLEKQYLTDWIVLTLSDMISVSQWCCCSLESHWAWEWLNQKCKISVNRRARVLSKEEKQTLKPFSRSFKFSWQRRWLHRSSSSVNFTFGFSLASLVLSLSFSFTGLEGNSSHCGMKSSWIRISPGTWVVVRQPPPPPPLSSMENPPRRWMSAQAVAAAASAVELNDRGAQCWRLISPFSFHTSLTLRLSNPLPSVFPCPGSFKRRLSLEPLSLHKLASKPKLKWHLQLETARYLFIFSQPFV